MIALLIGLLPFLPIETIYGPGAISYQDFEPVIAYRQWDNTEQFDILIAPADCNLLGRWVWVISESGSRLGLVADCESPKDAGGLEENGLLFDGSDPESVGDVAYFVVIPKLMTR